jgi:MoxR-like ATPase
MQTPPPTDQPTVQAARSPHPLEQALYEVKKTIVGQDGLLERMFVALLARGHLLVEGVPGLAKTMAIKSLAHAIGGDFGRIQFTPDLVPADVIGTRIYNQREGEFEVSLGPVFANLLLADEINRAPAKVQSALLEVMQERQVTIGRTTYRAPDPFLVMATQNPIESEGTYPLPEAQVDRFMLKVLVGYPSPEEEFVVVERMTAPSVPLTRVLDPETLRGYQHAADAVYVDPGIIQYAVRLATATRAPATAGRSDLAKYLAFGASPRASINLVQAAKALAFLRGRDYALPVDARDLVRDIFRHRLVLSYEALADGVSPDDLLGPLMDAVPLPDIPLRERAGRATAALGAQSRATGPGDGQPWRRRP